MIVIAILAFLGWAFMPRMIGCKAKATTITCANNLKQVSYAYRIWAGDHQDLLPMKVSITNGGAMEAILTGNVATVFQVMSNELNTPKILFCPTDKKRIQTATFASTNQRLSNSNFSYFVGLDTNTNLLGTFLSGDDNILSNGVTVNPGILLLKTNSEVSWSEKRHEKQGNVGLADGSVQGFSTSALRAALANTGVETNRLAMP